jgi:putative membrane protein
MKALVSLAAAAALLASPASFAAESTATDKADPASFAQKAAQAGMAEVELGKLAQAQSRNADVKAFAARMVADHGKANEELKTIAKAKGMQLPTKLDQMHQSMVDKFKGKTGPEFDIAYSQQMVDDHAKAVDLFSQATRSNDREIAAFARKTLPTVQDHKKEADAMAAQRLSSGEQRPSGSAPR